MTEEIARTQPPADEPTTSASGVTRRDVLRRTGAVAAGAALAGGLRYGTAARPGAAPAVLRQGNGEIRLYNWYAAWINEVAPIFEEETGITVVPLGNYSSNDEWWARLNAGETWDFFIPTTDWIQRSIEADLLLPLDDSLIPNIANLFEDFQNLEEVQRDGERYAVPFSRLYYTLTYNTEVFNEAPTSWEVMWDPEYQNQITAQDSSFARVAITALTLGDDPIVPEDRDAIRAKLEEQVPLVRTFWRDYQTGMELFVNNEVVVGQITDGRTRMGQDLGGTIDWTIPDEGALFFVDHFAIPRTAPNPEAGHEFINFLHRPDIMAIQMRGMRYDTVNEAALDELDEDERVQFELETDAPVILAPEVPANVRRENDELWTEVLLGG